jgi:hypothetical protein
VPVENMRIQKGDRALRFREARELYGIPEHRLRLYRARRALDFFKLGRAVFVSEQSLVKFLESHRELASPEGIGAAANPVTNPKGPATRDPRTAHLRGAEETNGRESWQ